MKKNFPFIAAQIIFILSLIVSIYSVFRFVTYEKIPGTVTDIERYYSGTVVHLQYTVNDKVYERTSNYGKGKSIKIGKQITLWYDPDDPDKTVCVRDFAGFYCLAAIMGCGLYLLPFIGLLIKLSNKIREKRENKQQRRTSLF